MCVANQHNISSSCLTHYLFFWCVLAPLIYIYNLFAIVLQIVEVHIYKVLFWLLVLLVQCHSILLHLELISVMHVANHLGVSWIYFAFGKFHSNGMLVVTILTFVVSSCVFYNSFEFIFILICQHFVCATYPMYIILVF